MSYLFKIAYNILGNNQDCEECLNDTYLNVWNSIPPIRPNCLTAFLGKITRNLALNIYYMKKREKRGAGSIELALHELEECIAVENGIEKIVENSAITDVINKFLDNIQLKDRCIFVRRYYFIDSVTDIAEMYDISETNVQTRLYRMRKKLKQYLEREGVFL